MARGVISDGETGPADARRRPSGAAGLDARLRPVWRAGDGDGAGVPALSDRLILELKYRGAPPAIFRQLVEEFALTPQAASKYRLGMVALGQAVPEAAHDQATGTDAFYA